MIDQRLFKLCKKNDLFLVVFFRLVYLALSIFMWGGIAFQLASLLQTGVMNELFLFMLCVLVLTGKFLLTKMIEKLTLRMSAELRLNIRQSVLEKALKLPKNQMELSSSSLAQLSVEGIEQLDIYYARFLPQLFYCLLSALMIFVTLMNYALKPAIVLLVCLPFIPIIIMSVMKIAKRILSGYWSKYTDLGEKFHENLAGLSTLKAYHQDQVQQKEMAEDAQNFRKITMSLLAMQLNSITIMDIVSYCGAALGIVLALFAYMQTEITLLGMMMFILLSAEFFIPMRQLGSLFHVAMNGISACKKIFDFLDLPEEQLGENHFTDELVQITVENVDFSYQPAHEALVKNLSFTITKGEFTAIVGKSGSGKSTLFQLLLHQLNGYDGNIWWNNYELSTLNKQTVASKALLVDNKGYLYSTTIKDNLLMGKESIADEKLWQVLEKVQLDKFVQQLPNGLNQKLAENGRNLSGGQRQRLLLARALLQDVQLYAFDEVTSGVDLKSETIIVNCLKELAKTRLVLFISHRLYNVLDADNILVFSEGKLVESGKPSKLLEKSTYFKNYFQQEQKELQ